MTLCLLLPFCLLQDKPALTKKPGLTLCQVAESLEVVLAWLCYPLRNGCARLQGIRDCLLGRVACDAATAVLTNSDTWRNSHHNFSLQCQSGKRSRIQLVPAFKLEWLKLPVGAVRLHWAASRLTPRFRCGRWDPGAGGARPPDPPAGPRCRAGRRVRPRSTPGHTGPLPHRPTPVG